MFIFKIKEENETPITIGFNLEDVFHFTYDEEVLHVVFKEQRTQLQQVNIPVQQKTGIKMEMQNRNVTDFFTLAIKDQEVISRFLEEIAK